MHTESEATILFSDIRDFTEFTFREGDREALNLIEQFHLISQPHIAQHQGTVIKTYGDGMMVQFNECPRAVDAAINIQRDCLTYSSNDRNCPIQVGIGIHCGEVLRSDDDVFGHSVNLAKRLADEARSSQIVISDAVLCGLTDDETCYELLELGTRSIKGIGEIKIHEVVWREEVARIATVDEGCCCILSEDNKFTLQLTKTAQDAIQQLHGGASLSKKKHGLFRSLFSRILANVIDRALAHTGIGIEHEIDQVKLSLEEGNLRIRMGIEDPREIILRVSDLDQAQLGAFIKAFEEKLSAIESELSITEKT